MRGILTVAAEPIGQRQALVILAIEDFWSELSRGDTRTQCGEAEVIAFFVGPNDYFQRMPCFYV